MNPYVIRALRSSVGALILAFVASCADSSLSPVASAPAAAKDHIVVTDTSLRYNLLVRTDPLDKFMWEGAWVQPNAKDYQSVKIRRAGITVSFPPGSVTAPVYVTIVAHPGRYVAYEFFPHGVTFAKPVKIQQDLHETTAWRNVEVMSKLQGGYLANGWYDIDRVQGTAPLAELYPVEFADGTGEFSKLNPAVVKFYTTHFSGYTLVSGVRSYVPDAR
jgi:hypothetical protein